MNYLFATCLYVITVVFGFDFHYSSLNSEDCRFTYEQGYNVGCNLAQMAAEDGCRSYQMCFDRLVQNTIDDFAECDEYILGVQEGFDRCFVSEEWNNNDDDFGQNDDEEEDIPDDCWKNPITGEIECP